VPFEEFKGNPSRIREVVTAFFSDGKPRIPGVSKDHLIMSMEEAIQKIDLLPRGFDAEATHHLFPV